MRRIIFDLTPATALLFAAPDTAADTEPPQQDRNPEGGACSSGG